MQVFQVNSKNLLYQQIISSLKKETKNLLLQGIIGLQTGGETHLSHYQESRLLQNDLMMQNKYYLALATTVKMV